MGMFGDLMNKIFHFTAEAEPPPDVWKPGEKRESRVEAARRQGVPVAEVVMGGSGAPAATTQADVTAALDKLASASKEKLDWRHSIVDLMKLVGMDSSLSARKELAKDLDYSGDMNDSAQMNMWLHKEVMRKLAENGGKVPQDLLT